ncbi:MAG: metal ABC transporter solute-binding protein, Zn/Mn family [Acidimicrobiales bacterium]
MWKPATRPRVTARALAVVAATVVAVAAVAALGGCGRVAPAASPPRASAPVPVVAIEDTWGSIATQLGGAGARVTSIVVNPNADPHAYEPTPADARALARARLVIENGAGYDAWAARLLAANPVPGRVVLDVARLVGAAPGANPHLWYSPADVATVVSAVTSDYVELDPRRAGYFRAREQSFRSRGLDGYHRLIAAIRASCAGVPVGASESVFAPMARALGLRLITPPALLAATSNGTEPSAGAKAAADRQIRSGQIELYVENTQNATPDVARQVALARSAGIPVVGFTETLTPARATFQSWQVRQLRAVRAALTGSCRA